MKIKSAVSKNKGTSMILWIFMLAAVIGLSFSVADIINSFQNSDIIQRALTANELQVLTNTLQGVDGDANILFTRRIADFRFISSPEGIVVESPSKIPFKKEIVKKKDIIIKPALLESPAAILVKKDGDEISFTDTYPESDTFNLLNFYTKDPDWLKKNIIFSSDDNDIAESFRKIFNARFSGSAERRDIYGILQGPKPGLLIILKSPLVQPDSIEVGLGADDLYHRKLFQLLSKNIDEPIKEIEGNRYNSDIAITIIFSKDKEGKIKSALMKSLKEYYG